MADDDDLDIGGDESSAESAISSGGIGGLIPVILKWVAIVIGAIVLIVTVVVITMNIMNKNSPSQTVIPTSADVRQSREVLDWYSSIGSIRTKTSDATPATVVVEVVLGYKKDDKQASTEITQRQVEIYDLIRRYFAQRTASELLPKNEETLQMEIRNSINDDVLTGSKIRDVKFKSLEVIEQ